MSQEAFAELLTARGFPWNRTTVYNIENGQRRVRLNEAETLASVLGVRLDELIGSHFTVVDAASNVFLQSTKVEDAAERLLVAQDRLRREIEAFGGLSVLDSRIRADVEEALALTPQQAVQHHEELRAFVENRGRRGERPEEG